MMPAGDGLMMAGQLGAQLGGWQAFCKCGCGAWGRAGGHATRGHGDNRVFALRVQGGESLGELLSGGREGLWIKIISSSASRLGHLPKVSENRILRFFEIPFFVLVLLLRD